jgi:Sulfotransferase family
MTQSRPRVFSAERILTLAERESGAFGLADAGLRRRLQTLSDWINERGPYSDECIRAMEAQIRCLLANRLKIQLDRQRFPQIREVKIDRPIFIIGFPRAGTTFLHSLIAEDPGMCKPMSWHMHSPSPPPGAGPVASERIAFAQRRVEAWMDFCPAQKPMHPYIDKGAFQLCEDEEIFALDLRNTYCYYFYQVPTMSHWVVIDHDEYDTFSFHREVLQHFQWKASNKGWVCKGTAHQGSLKGLFAAYPDALCIWPHRKFEEIYPSITALAGCIYDTITGEPSDWRALSRIIAGVLKDSFDALMKDDMCNDPRVIHMQFSDVAADPVGTVREIYERQGRAVSPAFEKRLQTWLADPENLVDRYGRYPYSYEALGLEQEWVAEQFAAYNKRFCA